jgi:hypothetical protein
MTTIITCIFTEESIEYLETWTKCPIPVVFFVEASLKNKLNPKQTYRILSQQKREVSLPQNRNLEKDTAEHLWNTHLKTKCTAEIAQENPFQTEYFAFLDFDAPRLGLSEWMKTVDHIFVPDRDALYIPGCWDKQATPNPHNINWRFCGAFFLGSKKRIQEFAELCEQQFDTFLDACDQVLTWEVNYWAWLEATQPWKPNWFLADHNESLVKIPDMFSYRILKEDPTYKSETYEYPNLSPYRPMSAAYVCFEGRDILNTRFVNYWIHDNGAYWYPEDEGVIRTMNVCSLLEDLKPVDFQIMKDTGTKRPNVFSEGIEDIRLFVSNGKIKFIGSTLGYSYCDKIRMVIGDYDVDTNTCANVMDIVPPTETWCEKNWAPVRLPSDENGFIYKWFPMEIGRVVPLDDSLTKGKLEIVITHETPEAFRKMKGSTAFQEYSETEWIGVVHFSEETSPRQYFHRMVVLDKQTLKITRFSDIFCFEKAGVEFCIGFKISDKITFWISQMDRDPKMVEMCFSIFSKSSFLPFYDI